MLQEGMYQATATYFNTVGPWDSFQLQGKSFVLKTGAETEEMAQANATNGISEEHPLFAVSQEVAKEKQHKRRRQGIQKPSTCINPERPFY